MSSLEPEKTTWEPNRYKATEYIINYDANGNAFLDKKTADYTGVNYTFAALPVAGAATTTAETTTGTTTAAQTTQAFGDVTPSFLTEGKGGGALPLESEKDQYAGFILPEKTPTGTATEIKAQSVGEEYLEYSQDSNLQARFSTFEEYQQYLHPIKTAFEGAKVNIRNYLSKQWENIKDSRVGSFVGEKFVTPGMAAVRAVSETYRPGANKNYRGVAGLYEKEINFIQRYGSTRATQGNPTGDPRKDDAGFNIVSGAGNYNTIGSYSRRSNMIKEYKEEGKTANEARADWKEEKDTGNQISNIDSSGSTPKDTSREISQVQTVSDAQKQHGGGGQQESRDQRGDAGKAGGEQHEAIGSF